MGATTAGGLDRFSAPTRAWFSATFAAPTDAQVGAWEATLDGAHVLVSAPTGSGKTLAAFLAQIDGLLVADRDAVTATRVLYVSPLKALAYDIDRNLRAPLAGIGHAAQRLGVATAPVSVGLRTGDTSARERQRLARQPPDILITTPESLFLYLTSAVRTTLAGVRTVIIDEVHAVAGTKRGAHLAVSLERLEALVAGAGNPPLQRVGLSATQRPLDEVARFLGGGEIGAGGRWTARSVRTVVAGMRKQVDLEIVVPVEDMSRLGERMEEPATGPATGGSQPRQSIWPAVHPRILELIRKHRSTIVFANSRRLAERLCASLNELDGGEMPIARAHHGSIAREQRVVIESELKAGRLPCVVATSSLELGIDMGAVDLVIQVESPGSVASGLQRVGRAGHQVGAPSVGKIFPKYRGDLVECAVVAQRMQTGEIEATRYPRNPLDVLAQQIVAMSAMDAWDVDELWATLRGAANFADLSRSQLDGVLDMLSGRYPADEFAELRPRINWDRLEDRITGRRGAQRIAVTSGGTIPDRGLYGVFIAGDGPGPGKAGPGKSGDGSAHGWRRVGELDEEMVYETRPGETFTLGTTTWRIEDITRDQVLVSPAPGEPGKLPFWHGDAPGRPIEVGRAVGAFLRRIDAARDPLALLSGEYGLDAWAADNLVNYLADQRAATASLPTDRTIVIERFRDEIGDWRVCVLSPFGRRVHAPWALAIRARAREVLGTEVATIESDDGIVLRLAEADDAPPDTLALLDPDQVEDLVVGELADSALFAARFRECAARALLLPRRRPGGRTPLWQQRQKAADLLAVAMRYGSFPILLETYREVLRDVFDLPGLIALLRDIAARNVRVVTVETQTASPFAAALLFDYIASYMYEGDAPLAERRAQALSLDRRLLAELIGSEELRDLIDPDALDALELTLQRLDPDRHARSADDLHDLLRSLGDLRADEVAARTDGPAAQWLDELSAARRIYALRSAGEDRWGAAEDAARFRDGLGIPPPPGLPEAFATPVAHPLRDLVARYARTHGPFHTAEAAGRLGLPVDAVDLALAQLVEQGRVVSGEFRPGGLRREWCDAGVLRRLRRMSLAALRKEVEAVEQRALARFLPAWQGVIAPGSGGGPTGPDRVWEVCSQLQGAPIPASVWERDVLAARVRGYEPAWLDQLCAAGELVWVGRGPLGTGDGRMSVYLRDQVGLLAPIRAITGVTMGPALADAQWWSPLHQALHDHLADRGASFWPALYSAAGGGDQAAVTDALWDLVWAGLVTNDTLQALRAFVGGSGNRRSAAAAGRRRPGRVMTAAGPPKVAGRWSLVAELLGEPVAPTQRAAALAAQLLDRHGIVVRDVAGAEDLAGGFSAVYGVLKAMEESGRARRGYFVEGLGGAQFAVPGAIDRLRSVREDSDQAAGAGAGAYVLAATDPANPYGAALSWPARDQAVRHGPRRAAGAMVVIDDGALAVYIERGGRSLLTFTDDPQRLAAAVAALVTHWRLRGAGRLVVARVDGAALDGALVAVAALRGAGFADHPQGLVLRAGSGRAGSGSTRQGRSSRG